MAALNSHVLRRTNRWDQKKQHRRSLRGDHAVPGGSLSQPIVGHPGPWTTQGVAIRSRGHLGLGSPSLLLLLTLDHTSLAASLRLHLRDLRLHQHAAPPLPPMI